MKLKTQDLTDTALDWAVATAQGIEVIIRRGDVMVAIPNITERYPEHGVGYKVYRPSKSWSQGGPIIEREGIQVTPDGVGWNAIVHKNIFKEDGSEAYQQGKTFLIAAMRCYVASKLGAEVDVPEELV